MPQLGLLILLALLVVIPFPVEGWTRDVVDTSHLDDVSVASFPIPVLFGVTAADLTPSFGDARGGGTRQHEGEDILAPEGAPIVSPTEAVVLRTGTGSNAGKYVYTKNPGGETFRYMHLESIADLEPGDELRPGDFIGMVGDTGNAPGGVYHLHLEVRDADNVATDPYPRLTGAFTSGETAAALRRLLRAYDGDAGAYAAFLAATYPTELRALEGKGHRLPRAVAQALATSPAYASERTTTTLRDLIAAIPTALAFELGVGDQGSAATLLQLYLIYGSEGPARDALATTGATGYFGPLTAAALREAQDAVGAPATGWYDATTRGALIDR